jgi:hypothetical protein
VTTAEANYYRTLLRPVFQGRKVIVAAEVLQAASGLVPFLREAGAQRPFVLAGTCGTGPVPTPEEAEQLVLDVPGDGSMMGGIRAFEAALLDLPAPAGAALDAYNPDREALVLGSLFTLEGMVAGRPVYGGRKKEWEALEDKTVIGTVFEHAGVELAASQVVAIGGARDASARLDAGMGTAWAGDARTGWWGGASYFKWIREDDDATEAEAFFREHCDRVRVMPFLEGIPCSIHGAVFAETEIAFRPIEMLTLRRKKSSDLLYTGVASCWDPRSADRDAMRDTARRIGRSLRELVDYKGIFTLDGVLTADGFRPTEINPRPGAGLSPQIAACELDLIVLNKAIVAQEPFDWRPVELEEFVVSAADARRGVRCFTLLSQRRTETESGPLAKRDGRYARRADGETGDGELVFGPAVSGGMVRYVPDAERLANGPSFAPTAAEVLAFTDEEFGTGIGPLEPARSVR